MKRAESGVVGGRGRLRFGRPGMVVMCVLIIEGDDIFGIWFSMRDDSKVVVVCGRRRAGSGGGGGGGGGV